MVLSEWRVNDGDSESRERGIGSVTGLRLRSQYHDSKQVFITRGQGATEEQSQEAKKNNYHLGRNTGSIRLQGRVK